ncbi:hypothetical protein FA95DRAFT_1613182 [Auriscalpium vulgare]|uniref:Uncharacterized protein n=1 Tax=Auriscalpium vulgare TaxID=40419 RepID=A0ACB8R3T6_9AGAM|nr:hypothetical protein FA95DRAFT_1613182 [Auriscalpium vulgare]
MRDKGKHRASTPPSDSEPEEPFEGDDTDEWQEAYKREFAGFDNEEYFDSIASEDLPELEDRLARSRPFARTDPFAAALENEAMGEEASEPESGGKKVAYVVYSGHVLGVFKNYTACQRSVSGYPHMCFKGYTSVDRAVKAWNKALRNGQWGPPSRKGYGDPAAAGPSSTTALSDEVLPRSGVVYRLAARMTPVSSPVRGPSTPLASRTPTSRRDPEHAQRTYTGPLGSSGSRPTRSTPSARVENVQFRTPSKPAPSSPSPSSQHQSPSPYAHAAQAQVYHWWVVVVGQYPGVYYGRERARIHTGDALEVRVETALTEEEACKRFTRLFMAGEVRYIV